MSAASAYLIACHSGENAANGQNAACCGSPGTYPSSATGGRICGSAASAISASASGGPSIRTTSGRCSASAARTDRADPGPWCLMPYRRRCYLVLLIRPTSRQAR